MSPIELVWFAAGLLALVAGTMGIARAAGVGLGITPLVALTRASVQLSIVALILRGVLEAPWTVVAFLALMFTTATWTSAGRLSSLWHGRRAATAGVLTGATLALASIFALRLVDLDVRYLIAVGGIIIGNAMTAATLSGRNFLRGARHRREEVEAWFSIGATPAEAHREIGQEAAREALLPTLDQTRSTGLVTLPGAFVGALFGGASPAQAAQFQLVVLAGVALAMTACGVVVTRMLGRSPYVSVDA